MNTINFTYTKKDGSTSDRVVLVSRIPYEFYAGTDLSELTAEEQGIYLAKRKELEAKYLAEISALNNEMDLNYRYRQFDPKLMQIKSIE